MTEEAVRVRRGERAKAPTAFSPWAAAEGVVVFAATAVAAIGTAGLALMTLSLIFFPPEQPDAAGGTEKAAPPPAATSSEAP